jgi:hypothetical protein
MVVVSLLLGGCLSPCWFPGSDCDRAGPLVRNRTEHALTIYVIGENDQPPIADLAPGEDEELSFSDAFDCIDNIEARNQTGETVASRGELCRQDEWVIEDP